MSGSKSNQQLRRLAELVLKAEASGIDVEQATDLFEQLLTAKISTADAERLADAGRVKESAKAGDRGLAAALVILKTVAGKELDRIFLAGLLGVSDDTAEARSPELLRERFEALKFAASGGLASDPLRTSARSGLNRLLLTFDGLVGNNFLAVCAGSINAIDVGDVTQTGWIAISPKMSGKHVGPQEVRRQRGYVALLSGAYYQAGYSDSSSDEELRRAADEAGVKPDTLQKFKKRSGLSADCDRWRAMGKQDKAQGRPPLPIVPLSPTDVKPMLAPIKPRGRAGADL